MVEDFRIWSVSDAIIDSNEIWIITGQLNSLIKYNWKTGEWKVTSLYPDECGKYSFERMLKIDDEIYLFPDLGNDIYVYDIKQDEYRKLNIPFAKFKDIQKRKCIKAAYIEGYIYCVNIYPVAIIEIDIKTKEFNLYFVPENNQWSNKKVKEVYNIFFSPCFHNDMIIIPLCENVIAYFHIKNHRFDIKKLKDVSLCKIKDNVFDEIMGVIRFNNKLLVYTGIGDIYELNGERQTRIFKSEKKTTEIYFNDNYHYYCFKDAFEYGGELLLFQVFPNCIYKLSESDNKFRVEYIQFDKEENSIYNFLNFSDKGTAIAYGYNTKKFYFWDIGKGHIYKKILRVPIEQILTLPNAVKYFFDDADNISVLMAKMDNVESREATSEIGKIIYNNV